MATESTRITGVKARTLFALTELLSWPVLFPVFRVVQKFCLHAMNRTSAGFLPVTHTGERHVAQRVLRGVPHGRPAVILDGGASFGDYSAMLLDECRAANVVATLHLFEPSTRCHAALVTRFAAESASVRIHQAALSNTSGRASLFFAWPGAGGTSLLSETSAIQGTGSLGQQSEEVATVALDDFCALEGIAAIDLLKLDIEGAELQALAGAEKLIARGAIRAIQFELGAAALPAGVNLYQFWLQYSGQFDFHLVLTHGLKRIEAYAPDLECFYAASTFLMLRKAKSRELIAN